MKLIIEELNLSDKRIGSTYIVQSLKPQINSLKIVLNRDNLKLNNITVYQEIITKNITSAVSQFVIVALTSARSIVISKGQLEIIISQREHIKKQKKKNLLNKKNLIYKPS